MCYCPTPTLHLNLALTGDGAFLFSLKKTHSVWFISVLNYGDTENVLINHLLLVIPMSYPCHYTNLCPHKPHKHAHTHTHTHLHTYTHTHTHTLTILNQINSWAAGLCDGKQNSSGVCECVCAQIQETRGLWKCVLLGAVLYSRNTCEKKSLCPGKSLCFGEYWLDRDRPDNPRETGICVVLCVHVRLSRGSDVWSLDRFEPWDILLSFPLRGFFGSGNHQIEMCICFEYVMLSPLKTTLAELQ